MVSTILDKPITNILITGDSLSYNRYDFDANRGVEPRNYGIGMGSWSFTLRDRIYQADDQFVFGKDLVFDCPCAEGICNDCEVPNTAMFDNKIKTLYPQGAVGFTVPVKGDRVVLYLQKRPDRFCTFDIVVDGVVAMENVNTQGDPEEHAGYSLLVLPLSCRESLDSHHIEFINITGQAPAITVAGAGSVYKNIVLSGRGSTCADFFIERFEDRIARHAPELILLSLSANDRATVAPEVLRVNLVKLFSLIFRQLPQCKLLVLLPPNGHDPQDHSRNVTPYTSLAAAEVYNQTVEAVCRDLGKKHYDGYALPQNITDNITCFRISSLFDDNDVRSWRFDNIHLNRNGNKVLCEAVAGILGL